MIKILTPMQKKFCRRMIILSLLFSIIFPIAAIILFNGSEHVIFYNSEVVGNVAGIVVAQIISIVGSIVSGALFVCSLFILSASVSTIGVGKSMPCLMFTFLSPVVSQLVSFFTLYVLVITGNHDYTLKKLTNEIPVIFDVAVINIFVNFLITVACFLLFYFSSGIKSKEMRDDKRFIKGIRLVFCAVMGVKLVSYIVDLIFTQYPKVMDVNSVMSIIVLPLVYLALEIVFSYISMKYLFVYVDKRYKATVEDAAIQLASQKKHEAKGKNR